MQLMLLPFFSRLCLRLVPLIALLCALVPVIGGRQAAADEFWRRFGFGACGLPCYAGITPGDTPFEAVPMLLSRYVPTVDPRMISGGASVNFWASWNGARMTGLARYDLGRVGELRLSVSLPVTQIVEQLGTPDCVLSSSDPAHDTVFFWQRSGISVAMVLAQDDQALDLNANLVALWLSASETNNCILRGAVRWRGFAPLWGYGS